MPGNIVMTKDSHYQFRIELQHHATVPGAASPEGPSRALDRGVAAEGGVVYVDVGKSAGVKAGDIFIVFHDV